MNIGPDQTKRFHPQAPDFRQVLLVTSQTKAVSIKANVLIADGHLARVKGCVVAMQGEVAGQMRSSRPRGIRRRAGAAILPARPADRRAGAAFRRARQVDRLAGPAPPPPLRPTQAGEPVLPIKSN